MLDGPNRKTGARGIAQRDVLCPMEEQETNCCPVRALPVSIGSISLSSCQLFLCARQIVAGGTGDEQKRNVEWGVRREWQRGADDRGQGVKLTLLL